jgi:hypothetical protein
MATSGSAETIEAAISGGINDMQMDALNTTAALYTVGLQFVSDLRFLGLCYNWTPKSLYRYFIREFIL